jgi:hypothetical protein
MTKIKRLSDVKVGDIVHRYLAGKIHMPMRVTKMDDDLIYATAIEPPVNAEWEFDKKTGAEVDEELNFGPPPKMTGSFITAEPWKGVEK